MKNDKGYIPNKNLKLTPDVEVKRLRKVIEEKNALIDKFKSYDAKRNDYVRRLQKNYELMEERFTEFNNALDECEELGDDVREYYKTVIKRLYSNIIDLDDLMMFMNYLNAKLERQKEVLGTLGNTVEQVGNAERRAELMTDVRRLFTFNGQMSAALRKIHRQFNKK
jgi:uncharacterized protein YukE